MLARRQANEAIILAVSSHALQRKTTLHCRWEACSTSVYFDMLGDWMKNFDPPIPAMLQAGVRVMIYAGVEDFICNWVGNQRWVDSLPWYGKGDWAGAKEQDWVVHGHTAGTAKAVGPLSFVKVDKAGHMVPMDVPANALDMITKFTRNSSLVQPQAFLQHVSPSRAASRRSEHTSLS